MGGRVWPYFCHLDLVSRTYVIRPRSEVTPKADRARPNLNVYAERVVLSIKSECLNRMILLGETHLRTAVREYVAHYNRERPHQGLNGDFVVRPPNLNTAGPIRSHVRLGGLLRYYHREAA
jgi:transposase InsO family protein